MKKLMVSALLFLLCAAVACTALAQSSSSDNGFAQTDEEIINAVLEHFKKLAAIPRPSKHEEKVSQYLLDYAKGKGFKAERDKSNNVIVDIPATPGLEKLPRTALQGHMDMVCVSDNKNYNPEKDPIEVIREGNVIHANGTSLGADDGIGISIILCVMDGLMPHGPIRAIFTTDEETSMNGAMTLDPSHLSDCACLINLDGEESGSVYLGCASCNVLTLTSPVETKKPTGDQSMTLRISGLKGGHSATMIDSDRLNAINVMIVLLHSLRNSGLKFELASFLGGAAFNSIPDSAECELVISAKDKEKYIPILDKFEKAICTVYKDIDPDLKISFTENKQLPAKVFTDDCFEKITDCGDLLIHGVLVKDISSNNVETSANLGVINATSEGLKIMSSVRSISKVNRSKTIELQKMIADLNDFSCELGTSTAIWEYAEKNPLRDLYCKAYEKQTGHLPKLQTTHGALECAYFVEAAPGLHVIAIGSDIDGAHSVKETCHLDSIITVWRALADTLLHIDECANTSTASNVQASSSDAA